MRWHVEVCSLDQSDGISTKHCRGRYDDDDNDDDDNDNDGDDDGPDYHTGKMET